MSCLPILRVIFTFLLVVCASVFWLTCVWYFTSYASSFNQDLKGCSFQLVL